MAQLTLNIHDYWRILLRRRWVVLSAVVATSGASYFYSHLQVPIYRSTAVIKIEPTKTIPGVAVDDMVWDSYVAINTEVEVLESAVVAERTALKLGMIGDDTAVSERQGVIGKLQAMVSAERLGGTNLVEIRAVSSEPELPAKVANATAEVYIEKGIEDRSRRARELRKFIGEQKDESREKLKEFEDKLKKHTEKIGARGAGGFLSSRLIDLETRKSKLLKRFTVAHPEVREIRSQISAVEEQMKNLPAEELEYERLSRELKINEDLYTLLAKRFKEAEIAEADREQSAFIVTPAIEPRIGVAPGLSRNVAVGIFVGIVFGFVLALFFENLDTSIGTIEDIEQFLEIPVLGIIPFEAPTKMKVSKKDDNITLQRSLMTIYHSTKSPFVESYHTMRTNLQFTPFKEKGNVLNFTSAGVAEGKTITAINYAIASAQAGVKTVLVEMDLRRPFLHKVLGVPRVPGLTEGILGAPFQEIIKGTADLMLGELAIDKIIDLPGIENLKIITCGEIPRNPIDFFNLEVTKAFVKELSRNFELVVFDSPPVLLFGDAMLVSNLADATVLVYHANKMSRTALKRAKDQLIGVKTNLIGVALNGVKAIDMQSRYGYYSSYRYYHKE